MENKIDVGRRAKVTTTMMHPLVSPELWMNSQGKTGVVIAMEVREHAAEGSKPLMAVPCFPGGVAQPVKETWACVKFSAPMVMISPVGDMYLSDFVWLPVALLSDEGEAVKW